MATKYEGVYIGLAELVLELSERPSMEEKGVFIDQVVKCLVRQTRGVNSYADSLMDQTDEYRAENARRQREFRDRQKGKNRPEENTEENEAVEPAEAAKPRKARARKDSQIADPDKKPYGPFENVYLTDSEYAKLTDKYGDKWEHALNILSSYKSSSGKTYKCDFAAFYSWVDKRLEEEKAEGGEAKTFKQRDREDVANRVRNSFPTIMGNYGL